MRVRSTLQRWWQAWMDSDSSRISFAALISIVLYLPLSYPLNIWITDILPISEASDALNPLRMLLYIGVYWIIYTISYCAITAWWYGRLDSEALHTKLRTDSPGPSRNRRWWTSTVRSDGTISISMQMGLLALLFTIVVMTAPDLRGVFLVKVIAVLVSVSNWVAVVITQTLAYARLQSQDATGESLRFPGTDDANWGDYFSFAVGISTMLGTTDAQLRGRRVRQTVRWHALVSFAFNSMVIASLATLMLAT